MCYYLRHQQPQPHSTSLLNRRATMVGKLHRPPLRIPSQYNLCSGDHLPALLPHSEVPSSGCKLHPGPSVPQKVVIGFDIGTDIRGPEVCDSPRSVLDANVLSLPREKHALTRLCFGGSFSVSKGGQGVGLALIAHFQAEEELKKRALVEVHQRQESLPISIISRNDRICNPDFGKRAKKLKDAEYSGMYPGHCNHIELVRSTDRVDDEMHLWLGHGHSHLIWEEDEDQYDDEEEDNDRRLNNKSIFAVASVPSYCRSNIRSMASFDACIFCRCAFVPGEDIFMYRGDQAFCSAECRARQIEVDEYMEKQAVLTASNCCHEFSCEA